MMCSQGVKVGVGLDGDSAFQVQAGFGNQKYRELPPGFRFLRLKVRVGLGSVFGSPTTSIHQAAPFGVAPFEKISKDVDFRKPL